MFEWHKIKNIHLSYSADKKNPQKLMLFLRLLTLLLSCAIGFSPAVFLVFVGLTNSNLHPVTLLSLLALTCVCATCFCVMLGLFIEPGDEPVLLLLIFISLLALGIELNVYFSSHTHWELKKLALLVLFAGIGGGGFAVFSRPLYSQGDLCLYEQEKYFMTGHLGFVLSLLLLPWLVTVSLSGRSGWFLLWNASHFFSHQNTGTPIWLSWVGIAISSICVLLLAAWILAFSYYRFSVISRLIKTAIIFLLGLTLSFLLTKILFPAIILTNLSLLFIFLVFILGVCVLKRLFYKSQVSRLTILLKNRHIWLMSISWISTLGSFWGLMTAFPLLTLILFRPPEGYESIGYPGIFLYAWMLSLAVILARPLGNWGARRWGSIGFSQMCMVMQLLATMSVSWWIYFVQKSIYPYEYFNCYLASFTILLIATGAGHAALMNSIENIFPPCLHDKVHCWLIVIASLGMTIIMTALAKYSYNLIIPFIGFALFYFLCLVLNAFSYLRRHAVIYNP